MKALILYIFTAMSEIAGCYAFFMAIRMGKSPLWFLPGIAALILFGWLLTLHPTMGAGRVYAAYGGVYIVVSIMWLWIFEKTMPDRWDIIGSMVCLIGAALIYFGPRGGAS